MQASIRSPIRFKSFGEEAKIPNHTKSAVGYKDESVSDEQVSIVCFGAGILSDNRNGEIVEVEPAAKITHQSPKLGPKKDNKGNVRPLRILFVIFCLVCSVLGLGDPHEAGDKNKEAQNDDSCDAYRVQFNIEREVFFEGYEECEDQNYHAGV